MQPATGMSCSGSTTNPSPKHYLGNVLSNINWNKKTVHKSDTKSCPRKNEY
uniref:Uncharacterized protein n=1 Tax=Arundo donax TaxID=35708 RepID=A0A0A8YLP2_ARUDO